MESLERRELLSVEPITFADAEFFGRTGDGTSQLRAQAQSISADGQLIVFQSDANDLAPNDTNRASNNNNPLTDVFLFNRATGQTSLVSVNRLGTGSGNGVSSNAKISPDGRYVLFESTSSDLTTETTGQNISFSGPNVFLRDLQTNTTTLISKGHTGNVAGNARSQEANISADGRYVVFTSQATNLVAGETNIFTNDVFIRDLVNQTTTLVSHRLGDDDVGGNASSSDPRISDDGRFVLFLSSAGDLVANAGMNDADVFVWDRETGEIELNSVDSNEVNQLASGIVLSPGRAFSTDGRFLLFETPATTLVPQNAGFQGTNVYLRDRQLGTTVAVTLSANGLLATGGGAASMTPDGRYVAFVSDQTDLVANATDTNGARDVFLRDMQTGVTELVSRNAVGSGTGNRQSGTAQYPQDFSSGAPVLSHDGRYVAFVSEANNLVAGVTDTNDIRTEAFGTNRRDVFVRDTQLDVTTLISRNLAGTATGENHASTPAMSADGRVVAFQSLANDLIAGADNLGRLDVFVRDVPAGRTDLASQRTTFFPDSRLLSTGGQLEHATPDGRFVSFTSGGRVFVRDRQNETIEEVSVRPDGSAGSGSGSRLSTDGRFVVFNSNLNLATSGPSATGNQVWIRDRQTGQTRLVSVNPAGQAAAGNEAASSIVVNADGRYVAWTSSSQNLVENFVDGNGTAFTFGAHDIFIRDLQTGVTRLVSHLPGSPTQSGNGASVSPAFSADGSQLIFTSRATDLVANIADTNNWIDVFAFDVATGVIELVTANMAGTGTGNQTPEHPVEAVVSANGRYVAVSSNAIDLAANTVSGQFGRLINIVVRDLLTDTATLVSFNSSGTTSGNGSSSAPSISADGRFVAFASDAGNLVTGDTGGADIFVRDLLMGTTTRVSVTPAGGQANTISFQPLISPDGGRVSFYSRASNLVANFVDGNGPGTFGGADDLFVRDLATGVTDLVSVNDSGTASGNNDASPSNVRQRIFSADGRTLFFTGNPSDLVVADRNSTTDVFAYSFTGAGQIRGTLFNDIDGSGTQGVGEDGLPFWTVFVDADGDRRFDEEERSVRTDLDGNYAFTGLTAGTYTVAIALQDSFTRTTPAGLVGSYSVTLATNTSIATDNDFGVQPALVDLDVAFVSAPTNAQPGEEITVTWSVRNVGTNTITASYQDAVFFSTDQTLDVGDTLLATVPHTGPLAASSSYVGSTAVTMPAVLAGSYFVIIQTDRRHQVPNETNRANNILASILPTSASPLSILPLATPTSSQFGSGQENRYFQINVAAGQTLSVALDSAAADATTELYISRLHLPTPGDYDVASIAFQPDQEVTIANTTAPGVYYVLARSRSSGSTPDFTITATAVGFELTGIDRTAGENTGRVTLEIDGSRFTSATTIHLVSGGTTITAQVIDVRDSGTIFATFDLADQPDGTYDVVATDGVNSDTLSAAFQILPASDVMIANPYVVEVITPGVLRQGRQSSILIQYTNTSNVDQPAPLLEVRANTRIRLEQQPDFIGDFDVESGIDFLGIAPDGPAGILRPGQTGTQRVFFRTRPGETLFIANFQVNILDPSGTTPVDWNLFKAGMQPPTISDDAWDVIFANFLTQVGDTTGDYVQLLGDNATYLSQLGIRTPDVARLVGFEVQQAVGSFAANDNPGVTDAALTTSGLDLIFARQFNNDIAGRYEFGPFGRGWSHNWDVSAAADANDNVVIDEGGARRFFTRQSDGSYRGGTGEQGTLTLVSGAFRLRESDGVMQQFRVDGKLDFVADPNGNRITAGYDANGRLEMLAADQGGVSVTLGYNVNGRINSLVDSNGESVTYAYDTAGEHLTGYTDRFGSHSYSYITGQGPQREHALAEIAFSDNTHIRYAYDSQGRQIERKRDDDQERVTFAYDTAAGVTITPAVGGAVTILSNDAGRPELVRDALGHTTQYDYDANNQLAQLVTPTGLTYQYEFCGCGSLLSTTDALGQTVSFEYEDTFRNLIGYTDARGNTTEYGYDTNGNLTAITYADGSQQQLDYDSFGNLDETINRRGRAIDYDYDAKGRLTKTTFADGTSQTFTYDSRDNLSKVTDSTGDTIFTHDPVTNARTRIEYPNGRFLQYTYNTVNQRTQSTDQDGFTVNYIYDSLGRLDHLNDGTNALIVDYEYDAAGRLIRRDNGNGTFTTYQYDVIGQLLTLTNFAPGGVANSRFEYAYDAEGRRVSMTLTDSDPATADGITAYGYDAIGQLVSVALPAGRIIAYAYDANGNRTQVADSQLGTTVYEVNELNQVTRAGDTSFFYDPDGNLVLISDGTTVTNFAFDDQNQLISAVGPSGTFAYEYDAFGNRRAATRDGVRTEFLIDPAQLTNVTAEYGPGGALVAHYTAGLGLTSRVAAGGATTYFDFDATGNTIGLTDSNGAYANRYSYLPFGETNTVQVAVPNLFQFVGQFGVQTSGDGLALMHFRNYSPLTAQFISDDPLNLDGGDSNLRRYVGNSPNSSIDPSGLENPAQDNPILKCAKELFRKASQPDPSKPVDTAGKDSDVASAFLKNAERLLNELGRLNRLSNSPPPGDPPNAGTGGGSFCPAPQSPPQVPPEVGPRQPGGSGSSGTVGSLDPNDIIGPAGFGPQNFLAEDDLLPFVIHFENQAAATAPAQEVFVTLPLNPSLDLTTFELGDFGFGPLTIDVPAGLQTYATRVDFTNPDGSPLFVDFTATLNPVTRTVNWVLRSVDPVSGEFPEDPFAGFLPPNDDERRGEGFLEFLIQPASGLATGTEIRSIANIIFDTNLAIATNQVDPNNPAAGTDPNKEALVTIDAEGPTSSVSPLSATVFALGQTADFTVNWSGSDDVGGSGIASFDIFVSDNGGPFMLWLDDTSDTSSEFTGSVGHDYAFFSIAADNVNHLEAAPETPDTATMVEVIPSSLSVAATDATKSEGNTGVTEFTFTVTRAENLSGTTSVAYAITGSGANPADVDDFGGAFPSGTVNFLANETSKTIIVNVTGNTVVEAHESFRVLLSNPSADTVIVTPSATGTIQNDDASPPVLVLVDALGNLTITDFGGVNNSITVTRNTTTNEFVVTATASQLTANGTTATNTVRVPVASVTAGLIAHLGGGNDRLTLTGLSLASTILGGDGNDVLVGGIGNDVLIGGAGNDRLEGGLGTDLVDEGGNADLKLTNTALTGNGSDTLVGIERVRLTVGSVGRKLDASAFTVGVVTLLGGIGNDTLLGGSGADLIEGGNGDNSLVGNGGNDTLMAGTGDDALTGGLGDDLLNGGLGSDRLIESANVNFTLTNTSLIGLGSDVMSGVELAQLTGGTGSNTLNGSAFTLGPVTLFGGAGNDILTGTPSADLLDGGAGNDVLNGLAANDSLTGGLGNDALDGGDGSDVLVEVANVNLTLTNVALTGLGTDTLTLVERASLTGGAGANRFDASGFTAGAVTLLGLAGNDTLLGGTGNDLLSGDLGNDSLTGGAGTDRLVETGNVNFLLTDLRLTGLGTDVLATLDEVSLTGGAGNNTLTVNGFTGLATLHGAGGNDTLSGGTGNEQIFGDDGDDQLTGGAGDDLLNGGAGTDTIVETGAASYSLQDGVLVGAGSDSVTLVEQVRLTLGNAGGSIDATGFTGRSTLTGGSGRDSIIGGSGNDALLGGDEADTLQGSGGDDTLTGAAGDDSLLGGDGHDLLSEIADVALLVLNDTSLSGLGSDRLTEIEQVLLTGGIAANTFNASAFTLGSVTLIGGAADDLLLGGSAADSLDGGLGNDTLRGNAGGDTLRGSDGLDSLEGGDGADSLQGQLGNDALLGGAGNDTLTGDAGNDAFDGGLDTDLLSETVNVNLVLNATQLTGLGTDTHTGIEAAFLTGGAGGNKFDATLFGGVVTLIGMAGNDTLIATANADSLDGGDGNDSLTANAGADIVQGGAGTDRLFGLAGNDTLSGGVGADTLDGGADNDVLDGNADADSLIGGLGRDLLIGSAAVDNLAGGPDEDLLIGGLTSHSGNHAALAAIMAEWTSANTYATRIANLLNGGGANGSTVLNATTVQNDANTADKLNGSAPAPNNSDLDWFFQSTNDVLDAINGEVRTSVP